MSNETTCIDCRMGSHSRCHDDGCICVCGDGPNATVLTFEMWWGCVQRLYATLAGQLDDPALGPAKAWFEEGYDPDDYLWRDIPRGTTVDTAVAA